MATLSIRNLGEDLKASLRVRAALHGQSMEEEVRSILRSVLMQPGPEKGLGGKLAQHFAAVSAEIALPPRTLPRPAPTWSKSES